MKDLDLIHTYFGTRLQNNVRLANHTTSRVGGPAPCFAVCDSADQLTEDVNFLWEHDMPVMVLGSGANVLVSDQGIDVVVLLNRARKFTINTINGNPVVAAESGTTLISVARETAQKGFSGLEWASTIPGTLGGAVYGNAGAHGSDMQHSLVVAEILHRDKGRLSLSSEAMAYTYRSSLLKRSPGSAVILSATLALHKGDLQTIQAAVQANVEKRRCTQPSGPCFGSTFRNPPGDHAGRLIEAAGLKGTRIGGVEISPVHANFMINNGNGSADDYRRLIDLAHDTVLQKFGIDLVLEIEILGNWQVEA